MAVMFVSCVNLQLQSYVFNIFHLVSGAEGDKHVMVCVCNVKVERKKKRENYLLTDCCSLFIAVMTLNFTI